MALESMDSFEREKIWTFDAKYHATNIKIQKKLSTYQNEHDFIKVLLQF